MQFNPEMRMPVDSRAPLWRLVHECVKSNGGAATLKQIEDYLSAHGRLPTNARPDATSISVNANSRVHYAGGREVRRTDTHHRYDLLFRTEAGTYVLYDPKIHGVWEIYQRQDGSRAVRLVHEPDAASDDPDIAEYAESSAFTASSEFRLESHLRDYLAQNLGLIKGLGTTLSIYKAGSEVRGVEYQTSVGPIDILAVGANGAYYVIELKLARGPDSAVGQTLRYVAAVRAELADGKPVFGVIVAGTITDRLRYAVSEVKDRIFLLRYELSVALSPVETATK